eukprot:1157590-Pelagomonas_calceolata.AAC.6
MRGHGRARAIACMCYKQGGVTCRPWGLRELGNEKNLACLYELALCVRCAGHSHQSMLLRTGAAPDEEELHADFGDSVRLKPHVLPGATGEIARILSARDFFAVMDVPRDSDAERIKKAFRSKLIGLHTYVTHRERFGEIQLAPSSIAIYARKERKGKGCVDAPDQNQATTRALKAPQQITAMSGRNDIYRVV